jgi:peptidoglycan/xylan/chitin deacetylase (PgdA/CDA1 family)
MRNRATVFMLHRLDAPEHRVRGHTIEFVREALLALRRSGAQFVSLRYLVECWRAGRSPGHNCVAFTIDDGFSDQAELVRDAFLPLRCPVTVFLISGFLDHVLWPWDDQLAFAFREAPDGPVTLKVHDETVVCEISDQVSRQRALTMVRDRCKTGSSSDLYQLVSSIAASLGTAIPSGAPPEYRPMSWDDARELERHGVDFGPHSVTHRIFAGLTDHEAHQELANSLARLVQELTRPVSIFAWPTGRCADYSARDIALARDVGLTACVATDSDYAFASDRDADSLYSIRRFALPYDISTVLRYGSWIERARQLVPISR